ncbi:transcriptional regulator, TetR family [Variovorax sp. YR634]|uniref:TetR/AcrR family transcriptional regulator n=1 Tax=Variovorax sp. YR634 TaxID=1884385 RepID=UPI000897DA5E|nr:TetR/AcrR family transcriptional regulator [Variovorax sp. YR634]SDX94961.1 transcriptional regulator, TetR family [Variovorax sp. YR634]
MSSIPPPTTRLSARPRGRPRDPARLDRMLSAAREQFAQLGLEGSSMDGIAEASGVSKVTLYKYFPSKEALFNATVNEPVRQALDLDIASLDPGNPREALLRVAQSYLGLITDAAVIQHVRMLNASGARNVDLSTSFLESGPEAVITTLIKYLRACDRVRSLRIAHAQDAAEQFAAMVRGNEQLRLILGLQCRRTGAQTRRYCAACVEVFLKGYAA